MSVTATPVSALYNHQILREAVKLAQWPLTDMLTHRASKRAQICGSQVDIGLNINGAGAVTAIGMDVRACALGQASAAIMAGQIIGLNVAQLHSAAKALQDYLRGTTDYPPYADYQMLAAARDYPARYPSILLPIQAAIAALLGAGQIGDGDGI